jgi:glucose-6-phosphate 1-epimerase
MITEAFSHPVFGPSVRLLSEGLGVAEVALHGGHLVSWRTADNVERLFVSSAASTRSAIRGGVPVCFPQFAGLGPLPKHGFARTAQWRHRDSGRFVLDVTPDSWPEYAFPCSLLLEVTLGPRSLTISFAVDNVGPVPLAFTGALHTYLQVADVRAVRVDGFNDSGITFGHEVDINFTDVEHPGVVSIDGEPSMLVVQTGFPDAVVWNIGPIAAASIADLGAGEWSRYVCVEAAALRSINLDSGARWTGTQTLVVLS